MRGGHRSNKCTTFSQSLIVKGKQETGWSQEENGIREAFLNGIYWNISILMGKTE